MGFWDTIFSAYGIGKGISFLYSEDVEGSREALAQAGIKSSSKTMDFDGNYQIIVANQDYDKAIEIVNQFCSKGGTRS